MFKKDQKTKISGLFFVKNPYTKYKLKFKAGIAMAVFARAVVSGSSVFFATCAAVGAAYVVSSYLGRVVYPMSVHDNEDINNDPEGNVFIAENEEYYLPNIGLLINKNQYEQMIATQKISAAVFPIVGGIVTAGVVGGAIVATVRTALDPQVPLALSLSRSTLLFSLMGGTIGALHDPSVGLPSLYDYIVNT